jgi:hypothetical protein
MMTKIRLTGIRDNMGGFIVYIDGNQLYPDISLKFRNHSPDGFAYGYMGSGPSQLALAILLKFYDAKVALQHYMDFKTDFVAKWKEPGEYEVDITAWMQEQEGKKL